MNKIPRKIILSLLLVALIAFIAKSSEQKPADKTKTQKTTIQKFQDRKFGMFIHWGLYAVPAGVWKGRYVRGIGEWIMSREKIPVKEYETLAEKFNPIKFDADEPSLPLDEYNTVISVEIEDEKAKIAPGFGYRDSQKEMSLYARDARIRGEEARYDCDSQSVSGYIDSGSPQNELFWNHFPYEEGIYKVSLEYACDDNIAGSSFYFYNRREQDKKYSGTIRGTGGKFMVFELDNIKMTPNTENLLIFGLDDDKSAGVKVRKIVLARID
jgi:hypothetical protein